MSATVFDHKEQLKVPFLSPNERVNEAQDDIAASPSDHSLDSSRRTMNYNAEERERDFTSSFVVELSSSPRKTSLNDDYDDYDEEEEENDDVPSVSDGLLNRNYYILSNSTSNSTIPRLFNPVTDSVVCEGDRTRTIWEEAALYVQEGESDAKFYHHPGNKWSKKAFDILHHHLYYFVHFAVSILLMLLVFAEEPAVGGAHLDHEDRRILTSIHAALEILFLTFLGTDIALKIAWYGCPHFCKRRNMLIMIILVVMYVEALTVLIRRDTHIRITRLLRPVFFIDTHYMVGVRRVLRQMFQSLKPIIDVLFLLLFFIFLFALFGYLLFATDDPDYFNSYSRSFVSLFIAQTTANHPDVMLESYELQPATPIFFVIYIVMALYFASNVLLAVVYSSFSDAEKKKFRKILFHRRDALSRAYYTLVQAYPPAQNDRLQFHDFILFMHHYKPRIPEWQVMCIFKALHRSPEEQYVGLSLEEFYHFYEVIDFKWNEVHENWKKMEWFARYSPYLMIPLKWTHKLVTHRVYKFVIGIIVLINLIFLAVYTERIANSNERYEELNRVLPVSFVFIAVYIFDITLNMIGHGLYSYFRKFWNGLDFIVILVSFICLCLEIDPRFKYLAFVRPLKLLRLIRLKQSYRVIMNTVVDLLPRLLNITILILIIYYAFAIIGLEFFSFKVSEGCCNTSWYNVERFYTGPSDNTSRTVNLYYLNNFNNILRSYATLFILMVVNNWYIIMEGVASEVNENHRWLARIYFMIFYIIVLIVLQVVISFIVEAFVLKLQATTQRQVCSKHPNKIDCACKRERKRTIKIRLVEADIVKLKYEMTYLEEKMSQLNKLTVSNLIKRYKRRRESIWRATNHIQFVGRRVNTKEDIQMLMYRQEIEEWIRLYERERTKKPRKKQKVSAKELTKKACKSVIDYALD